MFILGFYLKFSGNIAILISVAYMTLLERKVMASIQEDVVLLL